MEELIKRIDELIQQGYSFNWQYYSKQESNGISSGAWDLWVNRIEYILKKSVKQESEPFIYFNTAKATTTRGDFNFKNQFDNAKKSYIGALNALKSLINDGDTFNELLINSNPVEKLDMIHEIQNKTSELNEKKVFIVHGHDHNLKNDLEIFLSHRGLKPIVLHREADEGKTIIEKFEANSDVAYVFILLTPDEIAYTIDQEKKSESERKKEYRARPNAIFEFGYFVAKLGRNRVCALHKGDVSIPSDLSGFIYKQVDKNIEEIGVALIKELGAAGLKLEI